MYKRLCATLFVIGTIPAISSAVAMGDERIPTAGTDSNSPIKCEEALVSPVSGHAECVKPFGAPVEPPPPRPDPCAPIGGAATTPRSSCISDANAVPK